MTLSDRRSVVVTDADEVSLALKYLGRALAGMHDVRDNQAARKVFDNIVAAKEILEGLES